MRTDGESFTRNRRLALPDNSAMRYHDLGLGQAVIEIDYSPSNEVEKSEPPASLELELHVYWGGGEPTRAVWLWRGAIAGWAAVGEA